MTAPEEAAGALATLIGVCLEAGEVLRGAAARVAEPTLRRLLLSYADQRAEFSRELRQAAAAPSGQAAALVGSQAGPGNARGEPGSSFDRGGEADVLTACERSEEATLQAYREAIDGSVLSGPPLALVQRQYLQLMDACDHIASLGRTHSAAG